MNLGRFKKYCSGPLGDEDDELARKAPAAACPGRRRLCSPEDTCRR